MTTNNLALRIDLCSDANFRRHAHAALRFTQLATRCRRLGWLDDAAAFLRSAKREYYLADRARWESEARRGFGLRSAGV